MALNMKLQMRLSQQLIMTPQLQQAIKLLQLSRDELEELIDQALIENPVLEESEEGDEAPAAAESVPEATDVLEPVKTPEDDRDWQEYIASGSGVIAERGTHGGGDDEPSWEATLSGSESLHEHLRWQLGMTPLTAVEAAVARVLIGNLDDDGYLTSSLRDILAADPALHESLLTAARKDELTLPREPAADPEVYDAKHQSSAAPVPPEPNTPPTFEEDEAEDGDGAETAADPTGGPVEPELDALAAAEAVLHYLQLFDPIGVGARNLQECLLVQLAAVGLQDSLAFRMVRDDLNLLENKDLRKISRRQKAELDDVVDSYKLVMSLEPKPGRPFSRERAQNIIPDVYIYKMHGDVPDAESEDRVGQYRVVLNDNGITRLRISEFYRDMAERNQADSSLTQEYIQEKIKAGNWLMKSIEQRQKTILRVTRSILKHQYEFFEQGINYLRPLVLKDIAEDIDVHESTVSRITTNKYVHTPQGIFELKYFFTSGIDQGQGEVISSKKIKDLIHRIISSEDPKEPFTDIQIAEQLADENNIKVARRTVAKYREALNLLPSNKRKQLF